MSDKHSVEALQRLEITIISDTHMHEPLLSGGDLLIHCGDATHRGDRREIQAFADYMKAQSYEYKVFVPGNHDFLFQDEPQEACAILENVGVTVLVDAGTTIAGLSIYGTPWMPKFFNWAFMLRTEEELAQKYMLISEGTDILVTHSPPYGLLDEVHFQGHKGSRALWEQVQQVRPAIHCFGHIHEGYGRRSVEWNDGRSTKFINAAVMDVRYLPVNSPVHLAP